jgi:hypothetical protein
VVLGPDHLLIKGVPIVAPAGGSAGAERGGEELIQSLDLRVEKGQHTLITGPKSVPALRPRTYGQCKLTDQWGRQDLYR